MRGQYAVPADAAVIWFDAGLAFGTGNHETTRLCCERLVAFATRGKENGEGGMKNCRVLDAGCGSGILAIAALKLGAAHAVGVDIVVLAGIHQLLRSKIRGRHSRLDDFDQINEANHGRPVLVV